MVVSILQTSKLNLKETKFTLIGGRLSVLTGFIPTQVVCPTSKLHKCYLSQFILFEISGVCTFGFGDV